MIQPKFRVAAAVCAALTLGGLIATIPSIQDHLENKERKQAREAFADRIAEHEYHSSNNPAPEDYFETPKQDRPDLAMRQNFMATMDPATETVPSERLEEARRIVAEYIDDPERYTPGDVTLPWEERGPDNVGGRTRALAWDPASANKVWAGGVAGGLWYTNDITAAAPTWVKVDDFWDNIAICSIAFDPSNANNIFVGTGEGFFNADAVRGSGIWQSTDGGTTWTQVASTSSDNNFDYVNDLAVTSTGTILAATGSRFCNVGGLMRSTDGGASWSNFEGNGTDCGGGGGNDFATDLEIAANGDIYVAFGVFESDGIYKSTDDGASWTQVFTANVGAGEQRVEIACAPSDAQTVYCCVQATGTPPIYKSTDGGANWTSMTTPLWYDTNCSGQVTDWTRTQDWYDLIAMVDPNDANTVFIGGVDLFKSSDGAASWTQISQWWGGCYPEVHADQHSMAFRSGSSSDLLFGNDGGVYRSPNANVAPPGITFENKNTGYNVTQYYACAIQPEANSERILAGSQDNGTQLYTLSGMNSTAEVIGGDGGFCHYDQWQTNYAAGAYTYGNLYKSTNSGDGFAGIGNYGGAQFINPSDYFSQVFGVGGAALFVAQSSPNLLALTNFRSATFGTLYIPLGYTNVTAVSVSPNNTSTATVFVGNGAGNISKITDASVTPVVTDADPSGTLPFGTISCIEVGATDDELLVTFSNYGVNSVWYTNDGGTTWVSKENLLPDMPVRWALFNRQDFSEVILATEVGVWSTSDITAASPTWVPSNTGLANTRVDMLQYRPSDELVCAATHGRGVFTGYFHTPGFTNDASIVAIDNPDGDQCGDFDPVVILKNEGSATLTQVDIVFDFGGASSTYNWTGSLAPGLTEYVTLPNQSPAGGSLLMTAATDLPNGVADEDPSNDQAQVAFQMFDTYVDVYITTDYYGGETTWIIQDPSFITMGSGGPYASCGVNPCELAHPAVRLCLNSSVCYDFTVYDSFGDGFCCAYGNGAWDIHDTQGNSLASGSFNGGLSETANFCPPPPPSGTTYYSVATGNMSGNIWATTPTGSAGPAVFDCTTNLVIQGGTTVTNDIGNFSALDFSVEALGSFDLAAGANLMSLCGNLDIDGTFNAQDSKVSFEGSAAQELGGDVNTILYDVRLDNAAGLMLMNDQSIIGGLDLQNGNFDANGNVFRFVSTSTGTGRILEIQPTADYIGDMTAELDINSSSQGWRMMGTSVQNATLQQWFLDIPTTGFPGSEYDTYNFVNILEYDETLIGAQAPYDSGFVDVTNITNGIPDGHGRFVYVDGPDMCEVIGQPVKGTVAITPSFTNSSTVLFNDGWNLAANSYQCTIDWDAATGWTRTNIDGTIYAWDNDLQQWATYTMGGVGVNGGSRYIAPQQGFWTKANASGAVYSMTEAVKVDQFVAFIRENEEFYAGQIKFSVFGNDWSDEAALVIREGATAGYDDAHDGLKLKSTSESVPTLFTVIENGDFDVDASINSMSSLEAGQVIPLHFIAPVDGDYILSTDDFEVSHIGACLTLEDLLTGESFSIEPGMDLTFAANVDDDQHRFNLIVNASISVQTVPTSCMGENDGVAIAEVSGVDNGTADWYQDGILLENTAIVNGTTQLSNLATGTYMIEVASSELQCDNLPKSFTIQQPATQSIEISESQAVWCNSGATGYINAWMTQSAWEMTILKDGEAFDQFSFEGGDLIINNLEPGIYDIFGDDNCQLTHAVIDLNHKNLPLAYFENAEIDLDDGILEFIDNESENFYVSVWVVDGETIESHTLSEEVFTEPGLYDVTLDVMSLDGCESSHTGQVLVTGTVIGLDETTNSNGNFNVYQSTDGLIIELDPNGKTELVILRDIQGKVITQISVQPGQSKITFVDDVLATGIYTAESYTEHTRNGSQKFFILR